MKQDAPTCVKYTRVLSNVATYVDLVEEYHSPEELAVSNLDRRGIHGGPEPDCQVRGGRCSPVESAPHQVYNEMPRGPGFQGYIAPYPDVQASCLMFNLSSQSMM